MPLQWTGELHSIVAGAERDAMRMQVRMNTALLLRSVLKTEGPGKELLAMVGVTLSACDQALKTVRLQPEPGNAAEIIFQHAANLSSSIQKEYVTSYELISAMLDVPCMGQLLLQSFPMDIGLLRTRLYCGLEAETVQPYYSRLSSVNSMAVQRKPSVVRPMTSYIDPQPSGTFSNEEFPRPISEVAQSRNRLMTAGDISLLNKTTSQTSLPSLEGERLKTSQTPVPRQPSSTYRSTSSRELQQATTLDLARRLKEKKSKTSEARRASRELPAVVPELFEESENVAEKPSDITENRTNQKASDVVNKVSEVSEKRANIITKSEKCDDVCKSSSDSFQNKSAKISDDTSKVLKDFKDREEKNKSFTKEECRFLERIEPTERRVQTNPIISRRNMQSVSISGTVSIRRVSDKLPSGFNPVCLNKQKFPQLCTYGRNLLAAAAAGQIDPVIDREHEINQLIDILNKRRSNNPILVGEAGVGKTAIIEGLALRMAQSNAPSGLENHTIIALDYGAILCGTQLRGALQERIRAIKAEVNSAKGHIILFLDDIHNWLMTGSGEPGADAAVELKLSLSRGELMCIGASTPMELRRAFNSDPAFERRFDFIEVKAPTAETSIRIIEQGIIGQYADHHGISYESEAIREAVRLSERYIQERALPDKAISVLDRAGSLCKRAGEQSVQPKHVAQVIAQIAEIPVERLLMTEKQKFLNMESILSQRLIGHDCNIAKISNVIRRNHAGFGGSRPIGSFLFLGPTGVGKTEAAKVLADFLFGSPKNMIRFDMSEYMEQHSVAKLIGAPAGYVGFDEGGLLTEALRKRPYQIVLFDEIEKAHPDIMNIFLQIFDEGKLTDAKGRHVDFSNTVIIMTSNLGAAEVSRATHGGIGFAGKDTHPTEEDAEKIIISSAQSRFLPELWNRIEEKLVFHPLTIRQIERIAHLLLSDSAKRLFSDKRIKLTFEENTLIPYLIQNGGFDPAYGARPMRKTIQSLVESRVAEWILAHDESPVELIVNVENSSVIVKENT